MQLKLVSFVKIDSISKATDPQKHTNQRRQVEGGFERSLPRRGFKRPEMEDFRKRYVKFEPEEMTSSFPPSPTPSSPRPTGRRYAMATELVFVDNPETGGSRDQYGSSSMPIYQTATFKQSSASEMGEYDYTRSGNPTRSHLGRNSKLTGN